MQKLLLFLLLAPFLSFCQRDSVPAEKYPPSVGDIAFDPHTDDPNFQTCYDYVYQYFNFGRGLEYQGEKIALEREFHQAYRSTKAKKESGTLRLRFIVNCKGQCDRFRFQGMDENYQPKTFDRSISDQLLTIAKGLRGWKKKYTERNEAIDYYQYLIFKIEKGEIKEILP
jgi:hypothetical protein